MRNAGAFNLGAIQQCIRVAIVAALLILARPAGLADANRHTPVCLFAAGRTAPCRRFESKFPATCKSYDCAFNLGAPCRIRTCDLRIRNPMLYPAGLRAHSAYSILSFGKFQVLHKPQKNTARMGGVFLYHGLFTPRPTRFWFCCLFDSPWLTIIHLPGTHPCFGDNFF